MFWIGARRRSRITVFQPCIFQRVSFFGNDHRGGFRRVDDVYVFGVDFNLPGRHLRIFILAFDNLPLDLQDIFVADVLDLFGQFFIHGNLNDAAAVAQVDKDQRASCAAGNQPTTVTCSPALAKRSSPLL